MKFDYKVFFFHRNRFSLCFWRLRKWSRWFRCWKNFLRTTQRRKKMLTDLKLYFPVQKKKTCLFSLIVNILTASPFYVSTCIARYIRDYMLSGLQYGLFLWEELKLTWSMHVNYMKHACEDLHEAWTWKLAWSMRVKTYMKHARENKLSLSLARLRDPWKFG